MAKVKTTRTEHYKIADFTFVEIAATVSDEYPTIEEGLEKNSDLLQKHLKKQRKDLFKAFQNGEFDIAG